MKRRGFYVLIVQVLLIIGVVSKYKWDQHRYPMVWTMADQHDAPIPLTDRYVTVHLRVNACALMSAKPLSERDESHVDDGPDMKRSTDHPEDSEAMVKAFREMKLHQIHVKVYDLATIARDGKLIALPGNAETGKLSERLDIRDGQSCDSVPLFRSTEVFVPESASEHFPMHPNEQLWALVTVPPSGPPRPVELAISDSTGFHPLNLR